MAAAASFSLVIGAWTLDIKMYHFHVNLLADPAFPCTWEQAAAALEALPRMMFEPDGSWIFSGGVGRERWQVDGHLFDFENRLHRVELHGKCPEAAFDDLLRCFGSPATTLVFEKVREGVTVDEAEFRRQATQ